MNEIRCRYCAREMKDIVEYAAGHILRWCYFCGALSSAACDGSEIPEWKFPETAKTTSEVQGVRRGKMFAWKVDYRIHTNSGTVAHTKEDFSDIFIAKTRDLSEVEESMKISHKSGDVYQHAEIIHAEYLGMCKVL